MGEVGETQSTLVSAVNGLALHQCFILFHCRKGKWAKWGNLRQDMLFRKKATFVLYFTELGIT